VDGADAVFIAVGTPSRRGDGHADLSYVYAAAREIAQAATGPTSVVTKSTVPVGHQPRGGAHPARDAPRPVLRCGLEPEFLREGAAIDDFMRPDRVVVGLDGKGKRTRPDAKVSWADIYRRSHCATCPSSGPTSNRPR
jgi:UDPglucose 6-dehydrogenase